MIHTYEQLQTAAVKSLPCPGCGRKVRRQRTFTQTLNPFNRNAAGDPKTRPEVYESLRAKAAAWRAEPVTCSRCEGHPDGAA